MYNKNKKRSISRIILVGLVLQLLPQQTACASIAIPLALPAIAHYVSGFAAAYMAQGSQFSKSMAAISKDVQKTIAPYAPIIKQTSVLQQTVSILQSKAEPVSSMVNANALGALQGKQATQSLQTQAVSSQVIEKFRVGIRQVVAASSKQSQQQRHDYFAHMRKPSSFHVNTIPGGIQVAHESGMSASVRIEPHHSAPKRVMSQAEWKSLLASLPKEQAQVIQVRQCFAEGNIEAAFAIMQSSGSQVVYQAFAQSADDLFAYWHADPLVKNLTSEQRNQLMRSGNALAEFFDCLAVREMLYCSLSKTFKVTTVSPLVVRDAIYALCDVTKEGQLCCMPQQINQRLHEYISNADLADQQTLVSTFYLPNGILKDFAKQTVTQALVMPGAILSDTCIKERKILNDLVVAHLMATTQAEQLVTTRAISNIKYALSYPMPEKMKSVLLGSAELVCKSIEQGSPEFMQAFMVDAEHYKCLEKPIQFVVQTKVGGHKNKLIDFWMRNIDRKQLAMALCREHQLESMEHAVALVRKDLSEHALQLSYKIMAADPSVFAKGMPKFTTIVKEDNNHWIMRDMQGNVIQKSHKAIKDLATRKSKRYIKTALKELDKLPAEAPQKGSGANISKKSIQSCGGGSPPPEDPRDPRKKIQDNNNKETSEERKERIGKERTAEEKKAYVKIVKAMGYEKIRERSEGEAVFRNGNRFISLDKKSHNGGVWKMANSVNGLKSRTTRLGTYDQFLNYVGK